VAVGTPDETVSPSTDPLTEITLLRPPEGHNLYCGNDPAGDSVRYPLFVIMASLLAPISFARAAVTFTCSVSATGVAFGIYNPLNAAGNSAVGSWSVICNAIGNGSATVSGTLTLSTGSSGRYATRTLRSGTNILNYNIYLTPGHSQIIGDGSAGTFAPSDSGTVTAGQTYQVTGSMYGFMPALQDVSAGNYTDSIVVTVSY
jgi:spore coat protein U-like protein